MPVILPKWDPAAKRMPGWERRLVEVVQAATATPFAWGSADCLGMVADTAEALTGHSPFPARLRRYATETGAAKLMAQLGFGDAEAALAATFPAVAPAQAHRGDCGIVVLMVDGQPVKCAVVITGMHVVGRGPGGAIFQPRGALKAAYRIGVL